MNLFLQEEGEGDKRYGKDRKAMEVIVVCC